MKKIGLILFSFAATFVSTHSLIASQLDYVIAPEIKNDSFYYAIYKYAALEKIKTILEIGSSSGGGSTEAFVRGILQNENKPTLYCMELSKPRFEALKNRYASCDQVVCYQFSSVPVSSFPSENEIINFMKIENSNLNSVSTVEVLRWRKQDIDYILSHDCEQNGIKKIKELNNIDYFDMVLIDGSEFTGSAELDLVYGAKIIMLDDIKAFKNWYSYQRLKNDSNYKLVEQDQNLRNGFAIFKRVD